MNALPDKADPPLDCHQNWVLDEAARAWRLDIFLEPSDENFWVYRRDASVKRLRAEMVAISSGGVPYLKPEGVLLFKAGAMRKKDEADFAVCVPLMREEDRVWLKQVLDRTRPDHPWLTQLD